MLNQPPGEMPQANPGETPQVPSTPTDDLFLGAQLSPETVDDTPDVVNEPVNSTTETPVAQPQPVVQEQPQQQPVDPALVPWVEHAVTLRAETDRRTMRAQQLQQEQQAADLEANRVFNRLSPEEQQSYRVEYLTARQQREAEYGRLASELQQLQFNNQQLGTQFRTWQRDRQMEPVYAEMAADLIVKQEAQKSGQPDFPADSLRQFLAGFPPNAMEMARDKWIKSYQASRSQARAATRIDQMGVGGSSGSRGNWDNLSGSDLILMDLERLAR